ncbi:DUF2897 family protein [Shewanella sp. YIC-542]|uniref:DUF2897 family protein n=1 Tax=Shewanella mytili TaxID=3377111 RepID=UPI00398F09F3
MTDWEVWLIILLVIGVIFSNLAVLKYSSKFKLPPFGHPKNKSGKSSPSTTQDDDNAKGDKGADK